MFQSDMMNLGLWNPRRTTTERQYNDFKGIDSGARWPGFRPQFFHSLGVSSRASYLTSLCISFFTCKAGLMIKYLFHKTVVRIHQVKIYESTQTGVQHCKHVSHSTTDGSVMAFPGAWVVSWDQNHIILISHCLDVVFLCMQEVEFLQ